MPELASQSLAPAIPQSAAPPSRPRLDSVDLLRGLVMVLMALDHTRDFFSNLHINPIDLKQTFPALFLTRWITHFCAPVFVFLAGTGAHLSTMRGRSTRELSWFLFTRGLWLVLLELTCVNWFGWHFKVDLHYFGIQVIWAIGWSMIVLAGLVWLPRRIILGFGLTMIFFHNALDGIQPEGGDFGPDLWRFLHAGGNVTLFSEIHISIGYPLIPWIGVMAVGYCFASVLLLEPSVRRKWLLRSGMMLTILFVLIRSTNLYGDPGRWSAQSNPVFTLFSFLNCAKYPPSLCYLLMTLGPALVVLALLDAAPVAKLKPLLVFGRVPLFFYLLHLPLIHGLSLLVEYLRSGGGTLSQSGFGLIGVYGFWILIVAMLYPLCRWFAEYKRTHRYGWLGYL